MIHPDQMYIACTVVGCVDVQELVKPWVCDSDASTRMTYSAKGMVSYREVNLKRSTADGIVRSIGRYGDLARSSRSRNNWVTARLTNVANVPDLRNHSVYLTAPTKKGHGLDGFP